MTPKAVLKSAFASAALVMSAPMTASAQTPTVEDYAVRPAMFAPIVSPDGKKVAYRVAQTKKGDYYIEIRDTSNLKKKPVRLGSKGTKIVSATWLESDHLLVTFEKQVDDQVKSQEDSAFRDRRAIARADGKGRWVEVYDDVRFVSSLPDDSEHVLVESNKFKWEQLTNMTGSEASERLFRPRDYYRMNIKTGALSLEMQGNARFANGAAGNFTFDADGNARLTNEYLPDRREIVHYSRKKNGDQWKEFYRYSIDDYPHRFDIFGFDPDNDNGIFVATTKLPSGQITDTQAVYEMDMTTGQLGEKVFEVAGQDIEASTSDSDRDTVGTVGGFTYYDEDGNWQNVYLDSERDAIQRQLDSSFPGKRVILASLSDEKDVMTIGVRDYFGPSTYYLVKDGGVQKLGESRPTITKDHVFPVEYITYRSRDGRTIPAYVTKPKGSGPHPLIVMPHGGPWVPYRVDGFDEWSQFLASQGYMVIDPLFRGTEGLGTDHWLSSFGEWGKKMSDDMDDGALHLIKQGKVDPDRVAMFGWSFGGYSSFAAAVRSPQIYQCTIPGAGVNDPVVFRAAFSRNRALRAQLEEGYAGLSPLKNAADVSVPMLIIHGDIDRRVRVFHSKDFVGRLKANKKPHKYLELEGADHFYNYLEYDHRKTMYNAMIDFLKNDCGPGGL